MRVLPGLLLPLCACASAPERCELLVHNPLPITRSHELVAVPVAFLRQALPDVELDRMTVRRGREALPVQRADLDLDGIEDAAVTLLDLHPGELSPLTLETTAAAHPAPTCEVRLAPDAPVLRRLDHAAQEDARLPLAAVAALVRGAGDPGAVLFAPDAPWRVLASGPLWCAAELAGQDGARLRVAAMAGSPQVLVRYLPGPKGTQAGVHLGTPDGGAVVEVRPARPGGLAAFGTFAAGATRAVLYPPAADAVDTARGRLRLGTDKDAGWRCTMLVPWDGAQAPAPESAAAFGRALEALTERVATPPILHWR